MAIEYRTKPQVGKKPAAPKKGAAIKPIVGDKSDPAMKEKVVDALRGLAETVKPEAPVMVHPSEAAAMDKAGISRKGTKVVQQIPAPKAKTGAEKPAQGKKLQSMRLDIEVVDAFKAQGKGWQGKINAALRQHLGL